MGRAASRVLCAGLTAIGDGVARGAAVVSREDPRATCIVLVNGGPAGIADVSCPSMRRAGQYAR